MSLRAVSAAAVLLGLGAALAAALLAPRPVPIASAQALAEAMQRSGAHNPVTAVLLEFRAYDTLLEVAVLLVAAVAGLAEHRIQPRAGEGWRVSDPLVRGLTRWLVPFMVLTAGYLLWAGAQRAGGAFQAGAVLAGAGVLLRLTGVTLPWLAPGLPLRLGQALGLAVFLAAALLAMSLGEAFLGYPEGLAEVFLITIEVALTVSIGFILLLLFVAAPAAGLEPSEP